MKTTKIIAIMLAMISATQVFGIRTDGGRNSRIQEGYWERGELPWGAYFDKCNKNCMVAYVGEFINPVQTLACTCGSSSHTQFDKPFEDCPQDGWNELTVKENSKNDLVLACVNTQDGSVVKWGYINKGGSIKK